MQEFQGLERELKSLNERRKNIRKKLEEVKGRIDEYLRAKNVPGVKDKNMNLAVRLEEKEARAPKKNRDRDVDAMEILERYGVQDPDRVLREILEARKGEPVAKKVIKMESLSKQRRKRKKEDEN